MKRRSFIINSGLMLGIGGLDMTAFQQEGPVKGKPIVISTWNFGLEANKEAWRILSANGNALDAVEKGVMVAESDLNNTSVGRGGNPDRDGIVTLDASIMDQHGNAGSVAALEDIEHPISVARLVMEKTPHVMLAGDGARQFALENGFKPIDLLTEKSKANYKKWLETSKYKPVINIENHDTIGMLALDASGNFSGACTTSGLAFKMHGRVGDSPIIGAALYVDNNYGAAVCTGIGELVMKNLSSFLAVEQMRSRKSPQQACEYAIRRIMEKTPDVSNAQVGILAINRKGEIGACAIQEGFTYAVRSVDVEKVFNAAHRYKRSKSTSQ
ncbi:MAG TPA: N(4)-(beta-N-acetylglucosaminyl)-L-asparaginase [Saprospiraceae bacterium]|nr:N(4)-(beta-N-acetylglucosaminyl)-L-asparaginase [Saprospiraceae bacterium]